MGKIKVDAAGGFPAIKYTFKKAFEAGGLIKFFSKMASKNACKTCALGMGGQKGGMVNEAGHWPEFCKKSVQAQAADMTGVINEDFLSRTSVKHFKAMSARELENLGRIAFPMVLEEGTTHYKRISWDDAYQRIGETFSETDPDRTFFYASGRASNEAAFLLQLVVRAYGTNNINNCSYYCHQASGVALSKIYGSGTASVVLEDLEKCDLAIVVGANPASNHPRLITQLIELRNRGGQVIIINPLKELGLTRFRLPSKPMSLLLGSQVSDIYVQPKIGGDIALFKAILKRLIEQDAMDHDFIDNYTTDWESVKKDALDSDWDVLLEESGVDINTIERVSDVIAKSSAGIFMWAMGLTHHQNGVDNILALGNVALSQGWLGKPSTGLLPIRGHSNVQGVGSVGVVPQLKEAFKKNLERTLNIKVPDGGGMDTFTCMKAAENGAIDAAFLLGGNLYGSNPDSYWAEKALNNIPFTVTVSTKLNQGHFYGVGKTSLILPALARDEEEQATTQESMFNYVRISDGGEACVEGEMKSEVAMIAEFAKRVLKNTGSEKFSWNELTSHKKLREMMADIVPGYQGLKTVDIDKKEFQLDGRTFHTPKFSTSDGKAHFHAVGLPTGKNEAYPFKLMTIRSEGQFNSVVYEEEDLYRGNASRDVVMISKTDAESMNLNDGDIVSVKTQTNAMDVKVSITDISRGSLAMYYPEANILVGQETDPHSKTPAFKGVLATLVKS